MSRQCPICGDEIPATAHRNKKLCGKPECMTEQQRLSGRKSYHKLLGHTKPEKRSCIACSADITHLRTSRIVCEKPACIRERKRRTGYNYFLRVQSNLTAQEQRRENQAKYRAAKRKPRNCQICHEDISDLEPGRTICRKRACINYRERLRAQKGQAYQSAYRAKQPRVPKIPRSTQPARPKLDPRYQRKPLPHYKISLQPKKVVAPRIIKPEDDQTVKINSTPVGLPEFMPKHTHSVIGVERAFADLWNCGACRTEQKLCRLHQSMTDGGSKPPKW